MRCPPRANLARSLEAQKRHMRSEEHTSELQSRFDVVCRLSLENTKLTIAAGLQPATDGEIVFNGNDLTEMKQDDVRQIRAEQFGFIFQASHLVPFLTD